MDNSKSSFPTSRSHEIQFFSEFHEWEALTFQTVYDKIPRIQGITQVISEVHDRLEEEYSKRYEARHGKE